ncbi:MAG: IMP dehydrogenase, partial [Glaciecola sp.]
VSGVASAKSAMHLMRTGAVGIIVGVGSGLGSTTGEVFGISVPLATALAEVADARSRYHSESGRYVQVIAGAAIRTGGDVAKCIALGADAVQVASPLAWAVDAPAPGSYWGMSAGHRDLPRGRFVRREAHGTFKQVLVGPSDRDDGTLNLMGALRRSMAVCGYDNLRAFQRAELAVRT